MVFSIQHLLLQTTLEYKLQQQTMATHLVLPLDQIWTSFSALAPRYYFLLANFGFFLSKSSKLDDAFSKSADLLYLPCQSSFISTLLEKCIMLFLFSKSSRTFNLAPVGQILYLFNIFRYILLKLLKYTQGVMQLVNTEQGIVPSAMVNSGLSLFLGLPSFTCRGKLIYQFSHYIFFKCQFYLIIIILQFACKLL